MSRTEKLLRVVTVRIFKEMPTEPCIFASVCKPFLPRPQMRNRRHDIFRQRWTTVGDKVASYSWSHDRMKGETRNRDPEGQQDVPWIPIAERLIRAKDGGFGEKENRRTAWLGSFSCRRWARGERRALWKVLATSTGSPESSPIRLRGSTTLRGPFPKSQMGLRPDFRLLVGRLPKSIKGR